MVLFVPLNFFGLGLFGYFWSIFSSRMRELATGFLSGGGGRGRFSKKPHAWDAWPRTPPTHHGGGWGRDWLSG